MSASSRSERGAMKPGRALLASLVMIAIAACATPAIARIVSHADSGRTVQHVVINDSGIQLNGATNDSLESDDQDRDADITITSHGHHGHFGRSHIRISRNGREIDSDGNLVRVDGNDAGLVRVFANADVPAGTHLDGDVVAVFGSVHVAGQVTGTTVAVFGKVTLDSTARVDGDAVAIGGGVDAHPGSVIVGQSVSLGFLPVSWDVPTLPMLLGVILIGWLSSLFLAWMLHLIFPDRMLRIAVVASRRTGISFLLGMASAPLMVISFFLLIITVIGIPLAVLLPVAYVLMLWTGQIAATYMLGCRITRRRLGEGGAFLPLVSGSLFGAAFFVVGAMLSSGAMIGGPVALFFYVFGALLLIGLTVIGSGAFMVSRFGSRPADVFAHARTATPAAPPATPPAAPPAAGAPIS
jgi:hypothetical protein